MLRNGMWVKSDAGVGIYINETVAVAEDGSRRITHGGAPLRAGETLDREGWVHLVNPDGSTLAQIPMERAGKVEQAKAGDIPSKRVAHLSEEQLAKLGYE